MAEIQEHEVKEYIRTMQSRMMRHSFDHLPQALDARTAMIVVKNQLLKSMPKSPIPEYLAQVVEDPEHVDRWPGSYGPYILYRDGEKSRGLIELTRVLLNPELRLRRAALAELDRQLAQHSEKQSLFLSPQTQQRIAELREEVSSEDIQESLAASIEVNDLLEDDYFYQLAGVRQCVQLRLDSELPALFSRVLAPNERTIQFLLQLPIWSPQRQQADIKQLRDRIVEESSSLHEVLREYFRLFGHLPLAGDYSAAGVVASWIERHNLPDDPWNLIWDWANKNGSPLACYHACQLLCQTPSCVPREYREALLGTIAGIVLGAADDERWQLRCNLARHYCRHLEALDSGADGERVAAFAWWLAEYLGDMIDGFSSEARDVCTSILTEAFRISDEVWTVARPPVSLSTLRYATLFSRSIWATAILCELSGSESLEWLDHQSNAIVVLEKALCRLPYNPVISDEEQQASFAFESTATLLAQRIGEVRSDSVDESLEQTQSTLIAARLDRGFEQLITELSTADDSIARVVAHELRLQSMCRTAPYEALFESFSDANWRNGVLIDSSEEVVDLVCSAMIEVAIHDSRHDWRTYLPHFLALVCDEAQQEDKKRHLFACTVVASMAANSVSAVERLLKGDGRRLYEEFVAQWRQRIENVTPLAPAWIGARLRGMKAVLYVG